MKCQTRLIHSTAVKVDNVYNKQCGGAFHGYEQRIDCGSAYASQRELIVSKAPKARIFTNQCTCYTGIIDEAVKSKNRYKSCIRSLMEHVFGVAKRL